MTIPTVTETPLRLEPVTRDTFGDLPPATGDNSGRISTVATDVSAPRRF